MVLNDQLHRLYFSKWDGLTAGLKPILEETKYNIKPSNPLLLSIDNEKDFKRADLKVMFFGQETFDWGGRFNLIGDSYTEKREALMYYERFFIRDSAGIFQVLFGLV